MQEKSKKFYGKYRGVVTSTRDPLFMGRIRAKVPDVLGEYESGWAEPCMPFGGADTGLFVLPKEQAGVWIEFEHGDPVYPIWTGCWWSNAEVPAETLTSPYEKIVLKSSAGHMIIVDDTPGSGGITLQTAEGPKIVLNATSVEISNGTEGSTIVLGSNGININNGKGGTITLECTKVSINEDALEVM